MKCLENTFVMDLGKNRGSLFVLEIFTDLPVINVALSLKKELKANKIKKKIEETL